MRRHGIVLAVAMVSLFSASVWAHEGHEADEAEEAVAENTSTPQTLTGEVVDVVCYLSHGAKGLGKDHAGCGKKCVSSGLPVAIKSGEQLYLASMKDHTAANQTLADFVGEQVTVHGLVRERDGQHLIEIADVQKAEAGQWKATSAVYTCPMHPEVKQSGPGTCPKCGMPLEKQ